MQIRLGELRRLVSEAAHAVYGWPDAKVEHVYGVPDRLADEHPTDLGNLRLPKGPNSRDDGDDRPLDEELPVLKRGYGFQRGVSYVNRSNNDNGRHGMGGGF